MSKKILIVRKSIISNLKLKSLFKYSYILNKQEYPISGGKGFFYFLKFNEWRGVSKGRVIFFSKDKKNNWK